MENVARLKELFLFQDIPDEGLKAVSEFLEPRKYNSGQVIYEENEKGGNLYIVKSGKLRVYRMGKNMSEVELATLTERDIFGEMSFLDESPHTANVAAMEDTEVAVISKDRFEELAIAHPRTAYLITKNLLMVIEAIVRKINTEYVSLMDYMYVFGK
jgi:CRP/FNR family transcriptional regulator